MSLFPNINNSNNSRDKSTSSSTLLPARVKDISLSNSDKLFKQSGGWTGLGSILFKPLYQGVDTNDNSSYIAKPLYTNLKNYPLKEELVLIISCPSINLNEEANASDYYYIPIPIGLWNSVNHNAFPDIQNYNFDPKDLKFGNTFNEKKDIRSLLPEEGDLIFEGRWGNSIRFSSTTPNKKNSNNSWSSEGIEGDPIIIIRNRQSIVDSSPWTPIQEDINNDGSSIYLCSSQEIPINFSCKNLESYNITISDSFNGALQIPDNNIF